MSESTVKRKGLRSPYAQIGACAPGECRNDREALALSFDRADAVARVLIANGMLPTRVIPIGIGAGAPDQVADFAPKLLRRVALRWQLAGGS